MRPTWADILFHPYMLEPVATDEEFRANCTKILESAKLSTEKDSEKSDFD